MTAPDPVPYPPPPPRADGPDPDATQQWARQPSAFPPLSYHGYGGPPPQPPRRSRLKVAAWCLAGALGLLFLVTLVGALAGGTASAPVAPLPKAVTSSASAPSGQPAVPGASAPAPSPSTGGTYQGACAYTLGSDPAGGTAAATGDIQVTNTGNIGEKIKLTLTWPQEGYAPLAQVKYVWLGAGASRDVPFSRPLSSTELDNLQNYQTGHTDDGCTYNGSIYGTYGKAS